MTEINNNLHGFELNNVEKTKIPKVKEERIQGTETPEQEESKNIVPDTGVLGRSQIRSKKGSDVTKSVDEAVDLAKNNPVLMNASDKIFNSIYDDYIKQGIDPSDAYIKALLAEEEFCELGKSI